MIYINMSSRPTWRDLKQICYRFLDSLRSLGMTQEGMIKFTKKGIILTFCAWMVVLGSGYLYLFKFNRKTEAAWFNEDWSYRKAISATVTSSTADINDLQMLLTIDTSTGANGIASGQIQSSCQDLRFTNQAGELLPYYIDPTPGCIQTTTKIWVLVDKVPANTTTMTIYMYYGNPSAPSASDSQTFRLVNGLQAYWPMNETSGNSVADTSINANTGTATDATVGNGDGNTPPPANSGGQYSYARNFDGTDDYVTAGTSVLTTGATTVSMWVKKDTSVLEYFGDLLVGGGGLILATTANNIIYMGFRGSADLSSGNNVIPTGSWTHLIWVYTGGDKSLDASYALYVNGVSQSFTRGGVNGSATTTNKLGNEQNNSGYYDGMIDDVRVYNRVLSADEISQLYTNPGNITTTAVGTIEPTTSIPTATAAEKAPTPVGYWKFDDLSGSTAQDSTSNNLDGTVTGATWQTADACKVGSCLMFDGTGDYVQVADNNLLDITSELSMSAWINVSKFDGTNGNGIMSKHSSAADTGYAFAISATNKLYIQFGDGGGSWPYATAISTGQSLTTSTWYHVAVTRSGTLVKFYINGKLDSQVTVGANDIATNAINLWVGRDVNTGNDTGAFIGVIDEPKIYNYARSAQQIQTDFTSASSNGNGAGATLGASTKDQFSDGLRAYWKFNENAAGNGAIDYSGYGHTGVATGTTATTGRFGNGRSFNGTADDVIVPDADDLDGTNHTISMWCFLANSTASRCVITKHNTATKSGFAFFFNDADDKFYYQAGDGVTWATYSAASPAIVVPAAGAWYHVVGVHDSSVHNIYVNGAVSGTDTGGTVVGSNRDVYFGRNADSPTSYSPGVLDEVRIFNRTLSATDISDLYRSGPPAAYYKFDDKSQTTSDISGNGNSATLGATSASSTDDPTFIPGKSGAGLKFDGTDDIVLISDNTTLDNITGDMTLGFWVKPESTHVVNAAMISKYSSLTGSFGVEASTANTNLYHFFWGDGVTYKCAGTNITLTPNVWQYISFSKSGAVVTYYINGVAQSTTCTGDSATILANNDALYLGRWSGSGGRFWNGQMDDVKIYNYARTTKQVVEDMNGGHPNVGSPVGSALGHWKFDEGYGTTANNSGSQGSTFVGTLAASTSTPTWTQSGKYGKALTFDGTNDYLSVADTDSLSSTSKTVSAWVKMNALGTDDIVAGKANEQWLGYGTTGLGCTASKFSFAIRSAGGAFICANGTSTPATGVWYHLVGTYDGTNIRFYLNGKLEAGPIASGVPANEATTFDIGSYSGAAATWAINATIDEVKLYNYSLTASEVLTDYNKGSSLVLGAAGDNSTYAGGAANQEYCVPGDTATCTAPIARWEFEEGSGTSARDSSGNGYTGTFTNGPRHGPGKYGKGVYLDGTDDYVNVTHNTAFTAGTARTLSIWVKPEEDESFLLITKSDASTDAIEWFIDTDQAIQYNHNIGGAWYRSDLGVVNLGQWNHIVVTAVTSSSIKFYVNGKAAGSNTSGVPAFTTSTTDLRIGSSQRMGTAGTGTIDDARIYNYERTPAQIAYDYNKGAPVAHWKMDECQGDSIKDSSGNNNTGTLTLSTTGTQTTAIGMGTCNTSAVTPWYNGRTGKLNYSLNFDGTDDYVNILDSDSFSPVTTVNMTVSVWVKFNSVSGTSAIVSKGTTGAFEWSLQHEATVPRNLEFITWTSAGSAHCYANSPNTTQTGVWYHVVGVIENGSSSLSNCHLYINGKLTSTNSSQTSNALSNTTTTVQIGRRGDSVQYVNGQIDDVRIYNYALTPTQVKQVMNQGGAVRFGPTSGSP